MKEKDGSSTRGILHATAGRDKFALSRFEPGPLLEPFIEHYWTIHFDVHPETPYSQTVLSYPNVHLVFEHDDLGRRALLYGIPKQPFVRKLRGVGRVLGVKFRAGGFYPFWQRDVSLLTGATVKASEVFGSVADEWKHAVLDAGDDAAMARQAEIALSTRLPERDAQAELAARIVQDVMDYRDIIRVEQMSERTGLSIRQLQRLFRKYVGVTPKWVIKRFRLQETALRLEWDKSAQWAELAVQLGYFDQAHFIKDFKSVLGLSPAEYRKGSDIL
ncbi:helix-turn-helix domain-containing protein [Brevibacillus sp. AY1]|uniref:helix-turn-helix domain-containing protein n=1 Tax=Brevibacillus sp. AY1 TaxID=2807621 RepID=UPI002453CC5B|nr:helix-turn-helix domain-containing protein [Brevibacillus sp. AY1]MDH4616493.1 AraC family transcriptional regulator [Brevibacillus sp. AY1]